MRGSASGCSVNIRAANTFWRITSHVVQSSALPFTFLPLSQPNSLWKLIPRSEDQRVLRKGQQYHYWADCKQSTWACLIYCPTGTYHTPHDFAYCHLSSNHLCDLIIWCTVTKTSAWHKYNERPKYQEAFFTLNSCSSGLPFSTEGMQAPNTLTSCFTMQVHPFLQMSEFSFSLVPFVSLKKTIFVLLQNPSSKIPNNHTINIQVKEKGNENVFLKNTEMVWYIRPFA